jgi:hypothetical protein
MPEFFKFKLNRCEVCSHSGTRLQVVENLDMKTLSMGDGALPHTVRITRDDGKLCSTRYCLSNDGLGHSGHSSKIVGIRISLSTIVQFQLEAAGPGF